MSAQERKEAGTPTPITPQAPEGGFRGFFKRLFAEPATFLEEYRYSMGQENRRREELSATLAITQEQERKRNEKALEAIPDLRKQAEVFAQEHNVAAFLTELGGLVDSDPSRSSSKVIKSRSKYYSPTSSVDSLTWDSHIGSGERYSVSYSYIDVETKPEGDVLFHARESKIIKLREWKKNKNVFGKALKRAFNNPGRYYVDGNYTYYDGHSNG